MNKLYTFLVLAFISFFSFGCAKQVGAKTGADAKFELTDAQVSECKKEGVLDDAGCKEYQGAKMRTMARLDPVPPVISPQPPPAAPTTAGLPFPSPGTGSKPLPPQASAFPFPGMASPPVAGRGVRGTYVSSRVVPPCVDGRGGAINTDRMVLIDNARNSNFFITLEPLTVFEPCWKDRVDPVVVPIGGRNILTYAIPEGAATNVMATIPVGCLTGASSPSSCPVAPRIVLKAWRDLGPGIPPEYIGKWDATEALTPKMGQVQGARLIISQFLFSR